jgi:hypothetical protein
VSVFRCSVCGGLFERARSDKKTCSAACRKAHSRGGWKASYLKGGRPRKARISSAFSCDVVEARSVVQCWQSSTLVKFHDRVEGWRPGRINWNTLVGEMCVEWNLVRSATPFLSPVVPVEDLRGVRPVFVCSIERV